MNENKDSECVNGMKTKESVSDLAPKEETSCKPEAVDQGFIPDHYIKHLNTRGFVLLVIFTSAAGILFGFCFHYAHFMLPTQNCGENCPKKGDFGASDEFLMMDKEISSRMTVEFQGKILKHSVRCGIVEGASRKLGSQDSETPSDIQCDVAVSIGEACVPGAKMNVEMRQNDGAPQIVEQEVICSEQEQETAHFGMSISAPELEGSFTIETGACTHKFHQNSTECIFSPYYPGYYPHGEFCEILINKRVVINVVEFDIGVDHVWGTPVDFMFINGVLFSSTEGPSFVTVDVGDRIIFTSEKNDNKVITVSKFQICVVPDDSAADKNTKEASDIE
mmetsp:Transcript_13703/g.18813  ORF Transcript_13703/g.18813 Transcript_13703/m.18813 type:complete len:335 (-) Transcript_13703:222-1226(-)|eukprot:CAMPEP_0196579392 /NCGR_PEP_ID=MMETSP1081-20130531/21475_1 /TAXON_ID=36882 /ORGANISM="Pyramimonas amylifera, Strain CCMP720" /LENGTH=334 /DNA_ID=CAMNT_0041898963 /DNA_START=72 /DNA_END=1076 /DNA_ORIENTATION=+